ncbi:hypothetical protein B5C34_14440 [Pacificimonas flava]|uniref:Large polyvalent protein-associated domain-containing protein n=1 Tax=Pacificimonas flava TaxID=1234595 RepID=A0A219B856_9SPHN|nr:hypothetical protein B5C34_14440 [Pacificimonas flava]
MQTSKVVSEAFTLERAAHQSALSAVRSLLTSDLPAGKGAARAKIGRLVAFRFPTYQQWLAGQRANDPSELFAEVSGRFLAIEGPTDPAQALRRCPPGYLATTRGRQVVFRDRRTGKRAFTQAGSFVIFHRQPDEHAIRAALTLLANEKDAPLRAWGSAAFKKKVAAEAAAQGLILATTGAGAFSKKLLSELNVTPPPPSREVHEQEITPKPSIGAERSRGKTPVHPDDVDKDIPSSPNANSSAHMPRRDSEVASNSREPAREHQATLTNLFVQWEQSGQTIANHGKRRMLAVQIAKLAQETGTAIPAEHQKEIQKQVLEQRRMQQAAAQLRGQSR